MPATFNSVKNHETLQNVLKNMIINQFYIETKTDAVESIKKEDLRKAAWLASILATSDEEKEQFVAATFAKLLYLQNQSDEEKAQLAYTILSRTGNLAAAEHFKEIFVPLEKKTDTKKFKKSFGSVLDFEVGAKRNLNQIKTSQATYFVTDFQRRLWEALTKYERIAISAPTSAGKSFFIQHFIVNLFSSNEEFKVIYVVPTKALISQVSDTFKELLRSKDVGIKTAFIDDADLDKIGTKETNLRKKKEIYCVTPERCLKILQEGWRSRFRPDFIFIDEIQNVETNDNRAILLEFILDEIPRIWTGAKILFAGPFINNGKELYEKLLHVSAEEINTYLPAVFQLRITVQATIEGKFKVLIHLLNKNETYPFLQVTAPEDLIIKKSTPRKSMLATVLKMFGGANGNLIYAPKSNWCVDYAKEFVKELHHRENYRPSLIEQPIKDIIALIKDDIHPDYHLITCLKYGVAFHHGKLPDIIKNEIEYLFDNGYIKYLFCTSTLLQGVNLKAKRIFIALPQKDSALLTEFEFGNLIGRAGRIKDSIIGLVFCLERNAEDVPWSMNYFDKEYTKSVIPTSSTVLKKMNAESIVNAISRDPKVLEHTGVEYTGNFLKQKFIQAPNDLKAFMENINVEDDKIGKISETIEKQLNEFQLPKQIVRLNPSIDPVLQNALYKKIKEEGIKKWILVENDVFWRPMTRQKAEELEITERSFYFQFENLLKKLEDIFAISRESSMSRCPKTYRQMVLYAVRWLSDMPLSALIRKEVENIEGLNKIEDRKKKAEIINATIDKVITINHTIVTYILVKYFKLLSDLLSSFLTDEQKELYRRTLSLHSQLELGTRKVDVIIMISLGVPRSIALRISRFIPEKYKTDPITWLSNVKRISELPLESFYIKYLRRKGYLPNFTTEESK